MSFGNYSSYLARRVGQNSCCCDTGATGPTGPAGIANLPTGLLWSDYLYWDDTGSGEWKVGSTGLHVGAHAGEIGPQGLAASALGFYAGHKDQGDYSVAIGASAAAFNQGENSISIGHLAGYTGQRNLTVAIGNETGKTNQGTHGIAIGDQAAFTSQQINGIAIGTEAGKTNQQQHAIAIGTEAGKTTQGIGSIAIGDEAGKLVIGAESIVIGKWAAAAAVGIAANSIYISSTGKKNVFGASVIKKNTVVLAGGTGPNSLANALDNMGTWAEKAFYVSPIRENYTGGDVINREVQDATNILKYSLRNHEVVYEEYVNPSENFVFGMSMSSDVTRDTNNRTLINLPIQSWNNEYVTSINNAFATQGVFDPITTGLDWPANQYQSSNYWVVPGHDVIKGTFTAGTTGAVPQGPKGEINHYRCGSNWISNYPDGPWYYNSPKGLGVSYKGPYTISAATISLNETGSAYDPAGPFGAPAPQFSLNGWSVNVMIMLFTYCKCDKNGEPIITGEPVYIPIQAGNPAFQDYLPEQESNAQLPQAQGWAAASRTGGYCKCYKFKGYKPPEFVPGGESLEVGCETSVEEMEFIGIKMYPLYGSTFFTPNPYLIKPTVGLNPVNWYTFSRSISITLHGTADKIINASAPVI